MTVSKLHATYQRGHDGLVGIGEACLILRVRERRNTSILDDFVERFTINFQGSSTGGKGALQAPQRPVSARWAAGMRFFLPQVLHARITSSAATGVSKVGRWNAIFSPTGFACSNHRHTYFTATNLPRGHRQAACGGWTRDLRSDSVF
jgi:hypothetical protein